MVDCQPVRTFSCSPPPDSSFSSLRSLIAFGIQRLSGKVACLKNCWYGWSRVARPEYGDGRMAHYHLNFVGAALAENTILLPSTRWFTRRNIAIGVVATLLLYGGLAYILVPHYWDRYARRHPSL